MSITKSLNLHKNILSPYVIPNRRSWLFGSSKCQSSVRYIFKVIRIFYCTKMEAEIAEPPGNLHGMKVLDKEAFRKSVTVLSVETEACKITQLQKKLKSYLLRVQKLKSIQDTDKENFKRLLFNPNLVRRKSDFDAPCQELFKKLELDDNRFIDATVDLCYDNWGPVPLLKAVLPEDEPPLTSFSIIGHIVHVNLQPHLLEYKSIIGQILLDKVVNARTVVNKIKRIETVYRNFEMELLCGDPDYIVTVRQKGCSFKFDFSKVYWNPRLDTEHIRVLDSLNGKDVLFDVFCGVGPFAIPAAKKKCTVHANDLNPDSFKWLNENIKLNKLSSDYIQTYNKDGADFITSDVKRILIQLWNDELFDYNIVVTMNLPALGPEFLKCFKGLIKSEINDLNTQTIKKHLPVVHCYFFASNPEDEAGVKALMKKRAHIDLNNTEHSIHFVRNVGTTKNMYKVKLVLPLEYMISDDECVDNDPADSSIDEPEAKKLKCD